MTTKISVTRALATAKTLDAKIERAIPMLTLISVGQGKGNFQAVVGLPTSVEDMETRITSELKSVKDMIEQRTKLKAAIVASNAVTKVTIGDKEYTVAEAIEAKRSMGYTAQLLNHMRTSMVKANRAFESNTRLFEAKCEENIKNLTARDKKTSEDDIKTLNDPIALKQEPFMIDPLDLNRLITMTDEEYQEFALNVDFVLSESNASTFIEV